ncbi:MAG: sigma-54-dependent Fis family transcriptional regulator [Methylococcaceae bacterium]|nr:sigma-54-dependent Fis family transcriptional regulator [Methylococcaceae bacterium]
MVLPRILLIDDNKIRTQQVQTVVQFLDYPVTTLNATEGQLSLNALDDVMVIVVGNGVDKQATLLKIITDQAPKIPVVLLIDRGTSLQIATPIQKMVSQCHEWPTNYALFSDLLSKFKQAHVQQSPKQHTSASKSIAGKSAVIESTRALIAQVADSEATVLVLGESGTGKEVVAQTLHRLSSRRDKPFVPVNCGAIPGELLESELFGHEKGAFTGALNSRQGRFEMAEGGTLFLDEIGDMPMTMQVKLLRVLQERTFERVGSNKTIECDVRIIAATHRHLDNEIKENRFREDLFYRLNVFPIEMPALRDRAEDIPELILDLVARLQAAKRGSVRFTQTALQMLMQHHWPGNVRELANLIERLTIIKPHGLVDGVDLPEKFQQYTVSTDSVKTIAAQEQEDHDESGTYDLGEFNVFAPERFAANATGAGVITQLPEQGIDLKEYLNDMETDLIRQALAECNGVVAHAAKRLNMRRTTLVEKLRKFDMTRV